ncbi:MAG TPA: hypothetical protein VIS48_11775 [Candidatus Kryptonia bacterium]
MKRACVVAILGLVSFAGCVEPERLFRDEPLADSTTWYSGKQFQAATSDSITVSVAFENEIQRTVTFYMVVGNESSRNFLVAPEKFYYTGLAQVDDPFSGEELERLDTVYALDPESQLMSINKQVAQANATYATQSGLNAASALLQLVGDVATIGQNKTDEQQQNEEDLRRSRAESQMQNEADYDSKLNTLSDQRDFWANATLRKTTLFPNTAVGGRISFPVDMDLTKMTLVVPIDTTTIRFNFKQVPLPGQ